MFTGKMEEGVFMYVGFEVKQMKSGIILEQSRYMQELETVTIEPKQAKQKRKGLNRVEQKQFRSLVGKCNWASRGSRPNIDLSTKFQSPTVKDLVRAQQSHCQVERRVVICTISQH